MSGSSRRQPARSHEARLAARVTEAWDRVGEHPLFSALADWVDRPRLEQLPPGTWGHIDGDGHLAVAKGRPLEVDEWVWVLAHLLLHLGLDHGNPDHADLAATTHARRELAVARCVEVHRLQAALRLGRPPAGIVVPDELPPGAPALLARRWRADGVPVELADLGVGGDSEVRPPTGSFFHGSYAAHGWEDRLARGLVAAVTASVEVAGGWRSELAAPSVDHTWLRARSWFLASYPLLGAVMGSLELVARQDVADALDIAIAAVSVASGHLIVNPAAGLDEEEWRFVLAHEALHAALGHQERCGDREPYLWNLACDFVVNGWLVEMRVGRMPAGLLWDPALDGTSAEDVYDQMVRKARIHRRLQTLAGRGRGDLLDGDGGLPSRLAELGPVGLDELLRRSLAQGLELHVQAGRGTLPLGLVEEIRARAQPPIGWDARLADWFAEHVPLDEAVRTYARPSRRQSATPDIPRPGRHVPEELRSRRTFGVVLDTSGSMSRELLARGLGAIASYARARDVAAVRVVFCDAAPHDAGYLEPEEIAGRVEVRGRGGTVLRPALRLLDAARDFPKDAPVLVITDGECDPVRPRREYAFLLPRGRRLPFATTAPVFHLS